MKTQEIDRKTIEQLKYIVPPVCQGQAVTYAYASAGDYIARRSVEYGYPTEYEVFEDPELAEEYSGNRDFWDIEPKLGPLIAEWETE